MTTLVLLNLVTLMLLAFGAFSLLSARTMRAGSAQHDAWLVTGVVFTVYAANKLIQSVWGTAAFATGPGSPVYERYLEAATVFNHSRTLLLFVLYVMLAWVAIRGELRSIGRSVLAVLVVVAVIAGGAYGVFEGRLDAGRHYTATAVVDTAGFMILASVLILLLVRDSADRLLWFALATQGIFSIVGVLFLTAGAWADTPGIWSPPFWILELFRLVLAAGMASFAFARYRAAVRGKLVRGLLPRNEPLGRPTLA